MELGKNLLETIVQWDNVILDFIRANLNSDVMDFLMKAVSFLGGAVIWILIGIVMIFFKKYCKDGINVIFCIGICILVVEFILKLIIMRERPFSANTVDIIVSAPFGTSFPSGHTAQSFAAAAALMFADKRFGIPAFAFALAVGFSRMYLYVHYPSDVIAGAIFGTIFGIVFTILFKKLLNKIPILNK